MSESAHVDDPDQRVWPSRNRGVFHTRRLCRGTLLPIDSGISVDRALNRGLELCLHCSNDPTAPEPPEWADVDFDPTDLRTVRGTDDPERKADRRPWEYPDCPECESHVFVGAWNRGRPSDTSVVKEYYCYLCENAFDTEDDSWKDEV